MLTIGLHGGLEIIIFLLLAIFVPIIVALIDTLLSRFETTITKVIWLLVVHFFPFLGAILYLIVGRKQKAKANLNENKRLEWLNSF